MTVYNTYNIQWLYVNNGLIIVKFLVSQTLYMDFWLGRGGVDASNPQRFKSQIYMESPKHS